MTKEHANPICPPASEDQGCDLPGKLWESRLYPWEKDAVSVRKLLTKVNDALQNDKVCDANSAAVKDFEGTLNKISKEYAGIRKLIDEYKSAYEAKFNSAIKEPIENIFEALQESIKGKCSSKDKCDSKYQWKERVDCIQVHEYQEREDELFEKREEAWCLAVKAANKSKLERSQDEQEAAFQMFENVKKRKSYVEKWLKDLADLKKQVDDMLAADPKCGLNGAECRKAYAIALSFNELATPIPEENTKPKKDVKPKKTSEAFPAKFRNEMTTPEAFEKELTTALKNWLKAAYTRYYYYQQSLKTQAAYEAAQTAYDEFLATKRENFLEEVQYSDAGVDCVKPLSGDGCANAESGETTTTDGETDPKAQVAASTLK